MNPIQVADMPDNMVILLDEKTLERLDRLVKEGAFANRSQAIEAAVNEKIERLERLARECAKLDPELEQSLAEEGPSEDPSDSSANGEL